MLYPYRVNLDWLWGTPPGNDGTPATVRAVLEGADVCALAHAWLESLSVDDNGHRGEGGWGAQLVHVDELSRRAILAITSAGEDVADGIEDGTDNLYCFLAERVRGLAEPELNVEWQELERRQA
ncbi:hypothetical protein QP888_09685 [Corynebacterium sp. MSK297]|uniref:hypothetical protein n=1 Tax=Corynebacterium sp. MSK297 TaxID=3050221 RepID=UPI00254CF192|nr:hypothetical protein [Corynebacterium sp. MSK297]MDK8846754.1 hypothetical protein [Corynebacterium sp. MSK297]